MFRAILRQKFAELTLMRRFNAICVDLAFGCPHLLLFDLPETLLQVGQVASS